MNNFIEDEGLELTEEEIAEEQALQDEFNGVSREEEEDEEKEIETEDQEEEEEDDNTTDNNNDDNEEEFEELEIELDGTSVKISSEKELRDAVKALSLRRQTSVINNEKRMLDQAGLTAEDISLLADIKSGSKAAINKLLEDQKLTLDDLEEAQNEKYEKGFEYKEPTEVEILAEQITSDKAFHEEYVSEVSKIPKDFAEAIHSDPVAMKHFMRHVKTGLTKEIIPAAKKAAILENIPFHEAYAKIGRELAEAKSKEKITETKKQKREVDVKSRKKRSSKRQNRSDTPKDFTPDEIANMSDEDFIKHFGE